MSRGPFSDRSAGWILAGFLFLHLLLLRNSSGLVFAALLLLVAGAVLRSRQIFAPVWLEHTLFLASVAGVFFLGQSSPTLAVGEFAGLCGAVFLLRPLSPRRGMRVVFCALALLVSCVLRPFSGISPVLPVIDVAVLMIVAQQNHRPPEAARSFRASLVRSLRVVIPVSIVVILVFQLFPDTSFPTSAITGFAGSHVLNPGQVARLSQSRRVALVAKFADAEKIPRADQLYWRGQVLEKNEGLRWTFDPGRQKRPSESLQVTPPRGGTPLWRYTQNISANRGGALPLLDRVVIVDAWRGGQEIAVLTQGASVLTPVGSGALRMEVTSAADSVADPPVPEIGESALGVPEKIADNPELRALVSKLLPPGISTRDAIGAVADHLRGGGYTYTMRPGYIADLGMFLLKTRRGFCEHYAAATANLLRLGGVPARIVVGYHGGEWNPWLHTLTVRDSDAHAWVEAWDEAARRWIRFDPTTCVSPDFTGRMERELNSGAWPWYRVAAAFVTAIFTATGNRISQFISEITSSEQWEFLQTVFFFGLLLFLTAWLVRRIILRRLQAQRDLASSLLEDLNRRAGRRGIPRRAGETPLAWFDRLQRSAGPPERQTIARFARAYDAGVYGPEGLTPEIAAELRVSARQWKKIWKSIRPFPASGRLHTDAP
jgi:Transglutaminase-like enzymes, putative cysteine proteases